MIEEQGRVVALEPGAVWVETLRKSTCSNCSANAACGQGLMERLGIGRQRGYVRALSQKQLAIGDSVIIGVREDLAIDPAVTTPGADGLFHTPALRRAMARLPDALRHRMVWWRLPEPETRSAGLASVIEDEPTGVRWHSASETARLLALMSPACQVRNCARRSAGSRRAKVVSHAVTR